MRDVRLGNGFSIDVKNDFEPKVKQQSTTFRFERGDLGIGSDGVIFT